MANDMHFERYDMMSIIDGSRKCPNVTNSEKASGDDKTNCWLRCAIAPGWCH